jgi:divalent metal cation (Fe/Co/Zn/Cd) transporter
MRWASGWVLVAAAIEIVARALAYAFEPDPQAEALGQVTGGPQPIAIAGIALALAALLSGAVLWLSALGVRERHRLRRRPGAAPRLRLGRVAVRAAVLLVANSMIFTAVEATIHLEAGLGFHGMHCLFGPVHRDALPVIAALALIASAVVEAVEHAIAFGRRVVAAEGARRLVARLARALPLQFGTFSAYAYDAPVVRGDRGPPAPSFC